MQHLWQPRRPLRQLPTAPGRQPLEQVALPALLQPAAQPVLFQHLRIPTLEHLMQPLPPSVPRHPCLAQQPRLADWQGP